MPLPGFSPYRCSICSTQYTNITVPICAVCWFTPREDIIDQMERQSELLNQVGTREPLREMTDEEVQQRIERLSQRRHRVTFNIPELDLNVVNDENRPPTPGTTPSETPVLVREDAWFGGWRNVDVEDSSDDELNPNPVNVIRENNYVRESQ